MKNSVLTKLFAFFFIAAIIFGCEATKEDDTPPELPPYESMAIDFSDFTKASKTTGELSADTTQINFVASAFIVGVWNFILGTTLVVPVASFYESFKHEAVYLGDAKWQWTYDVIVLGATYTARMTGQIRSEDVKWEMYVSRAGIGSFPEFKWFEGTSDLDGNGGQWILYHSYAVQEEVLQIDWEKSGEEIGNIKYSYVRESSNGDAKQLSYGSYIQYGLEEGIYNAFYNVHSTTRDVEADGFNDVNIQWSTTEYFGRIKALHIFQDSDWHCWDSEGYDAICE